MRNNFILIIDYTVKCMINNTKESEKFKSLNLKKAIRIYIENNSEIENMRSRDFEDSDGLDQIPKFKLLRFHRNEI